MKSGLSPSFYAPCEAVAFRIEENYHLIIIKYTGGAMRKLIHKVAMLGIFAVSSSLMAADATPVDLKRAEEIVGGRCFLCHGLNGESASAVFPRLAGQHSEYIARQLADFKSGKRASDTMKPQAEDLTPAEMKALGAFFQSKIVGPREPRDKELLAVGKYIFDRGNN